MTFLKTTLAVVALAVGMSAVSAFAQDAPGAAETQQTVAAPGLLILKSFSSERKSSVFSNDYIDLLRRFIPMIFASNLINDKRLNVIAPIGDITEEDAIEGDTLLNKSLYKNFGDVINIEGVKRVAARHNARFVLLSDIKSIRISQKKEEDTLFNEAFNTKVYKVHDFMHVDFSTFLYDVEQDKILHNQIFSYNPVEIGRSSIKHIQSVIDLYKSNAKANQCDDAFKQQLTGFMSNNIGGALAYGMTSTQAAVIGPIFEAAGIKPDENMDSIILSASLYACDVRLFAYNKSQAAFSTNVLHGHVYGAIPNHFEDGVYTAAGDFDGDGHDELAISSGYDISDHEGEGKATKLKRSYLVAFRRTTDGKFGNPIGPVTDFFDEKKSGAYIAAGDFDGDGRDEIAVSQTMWYDTVKIFKYKDGAFDTANPYAVLTKTFNSVDGYAYGVYVSAGDFDGDGKDELVMSKIRGDDNVRVFSFPDGKPKEVANLKDLFDNYNGGAFIAAGDFDGDSKDELVVSRTAGQDHVKVYAFRDGVFDTKNLFAEVFDKFNQGYDHGVYVTAGDFDGCGRDELAISIIVYDDIVHVFKYADGKFDKQIGDVTDNYKNYPAGVTITAGRF